MAPITNELETLLSTQQNGGSAPPAGAKPQPAAAEIPVTVNGARAVAGSDKREPFSENTQTVLVFLSGAVIRLSSPVSPGQLLFLTNGTTKKEVVCQVTKSKTYSSASGYVELEFTEASPGFWGMRFPSSGAAASLSSAIRLAAPIPTAAKLVEEKVAETKTQTAPASGLAGAIPSNDTKTVPLQAAHPAQPAPAIPADKLQESKPLAAGHEQNIPAALKIPTLSEFLTHAGLGPELKGPEKAKPGAAERNAAEDIKNLQKALRKQDEAAKATVEATALTELRKSASEPEKKASLTNLLVPAAARENPAPGSCSFDFGVDEVKIPEWLAPLARNSSIISTAPETKGPAAHEMDVKPFATNPTLAESVEPASASSDLNDHQDRTLPSEEAAAEDSENQQTLFTLSGDGPSPNFGSSLALDEKSGEGASKGLAAGLKFGLLAATVLLAAGGGWYWYSKQVREVSASGAVTTANQVAVPAAATTSANEALDATAKVKSGSPASMPGMETNRNLVSSKNLRSENKESESPAAALSKAAANERNLEQPLLPPAKSIAEPAKKPSWGNVHLGAPVLGRSAGSESGAVAAPALNIDAVPASDISNANLLPSNAKQPSAPAAPLQVGGDVKTAALLSSVAPIYPQMARNQRVSGDVKIDALIGADGRVSATKVISGPALLHQAAVDAVRQWKYRAAMLNGQQVPMHLTVTVQFRLQQ
jgi:TonB family protein